jgi:glutathione S-transferase
MAEYQLYCFAQSGNCYRAALMLSVIGADWEPVYVDFFKAGVQRTPDYRENINEMGEAPVLAHGSKKLSQSGVILLYLAEHSGKFLPRGEDERLEALRGSYSTTRRSAAILVRTVSFATLPSQSANRRCWNFSKRGRKARWPFSISDCRAAPIFWARSRPSLTSQ